MANVFRGGRRGKPRLVPKPQWYKGRQYSEFTRNRVNDVEDSVTRNFTTSTSGGSEYWPLDSSVSLTANFSVTDKVATASTAAGVLYSGGAGAGQLEVSLTVAGLVQVDVAGVTAITGSTAVNDGKLNTIQLVRTGTAGEIFVNGVSDGTGTISGIVAFDTLDARTGGTNFFIGTHADIVVNDAGTDIHSWPIDEADPSEITDRIGSNDSTAVNFTSADSEEFTLVADDWLGNTNTWTLGDYTSTGSEGIFAQVLGNTSLTIGFAYQASVDSSGFTSGEMRYRQDTDKLIVTTNTSTTSSPFVATSTASRMRTGSVQPNAGATFSNLQVKRILEAP